MMEEKHILKYTEPVETLWKILPTIRCIKLEVDYLVLIGGQWELVLIDGLSCREFIQECSIYIITV